MHYRVRYSLDFDPKIRSGQVWLPNFHHKTTTFWFLDLSQQSNILIFSLGCFIIGFWDLISNDRVYGGIFGIPEIKSNSVTQMQIRIGI